MPRANQIQTNLTAGEISPLVRGRVDTSKYANGADLLENFIVLPQGGAMHRTGTKLIHPSTSNAEPALYPFVFSDQSSFLLEFTSSGFIQFFKDKLPVFDPTVTVNVTNAVNDGTGKIKISTSAGTGITKGFPIQISGVTGVPNANGTFFIHSKPGADVVLANSVFAGAYIAGGVVPKNLYQVAHPYAAADIPDLYFAQAGDVLYITHRNYPPYKLYRLTDTDWRLVQVAFTDGPYLDVNDITPNIDTTTPANGSKRPDVYIEVSAYSHTATVTSATAFAAGTPSADQGKYLEYRSGDQWRLALLSTAAGGATTGTVTIQDNVKLFIDATDKIVRGRRKKRGKGNSAMQDVNAFFTFYAPGGQNDSGAPFGIGNPAQTIDNNNEVQKVGAVPGPAKSQFSNTFGVADIGRFVRIHNVAAKTTSWNQITYIPGATAGAQAQVTADLAMVANLATGKFILSAETRTCVLKSFKAGVASDIWSANDVGRHIRLGFAGRWTWGIISAVTNAHQVSVTLYEDMPRDPHDATNIAGNIDAAATDSGITYDWRMGAWGAVGSAAILGPGYPAICCFHEQRLCLARTDAQVQTFWGSVVADFENMQPTELDSTVLSDSAINYTLASSKVNPIKWMESGPYLTIGTVGGEWMARSGGQNTSEPLSPVNVHISQGTSIGSLASVRPVKIGNSVLFVNRGANKVFDLSYSYQDDALVTKDLSVVSEHILRNGGGAVQSAWQREPRGLYWIRMADGTLACMTYEKAQEVVAWHRHIIAGGTVVSMAVVPAASGSSDTLYLCVKRVNSVHGATFYTIETLESEFHGAVNADLPNGYFLDGGVIATGPTTEVQGLYALVGQTVRVIADGVFLGDFVVQGAIGDDGYVTLGASYNKVLAGLSFNAKLKILPPEGGSAFGTSQGRRKRTSEVAARVYASNSVWYGYSDAYQDLQQKDLKTLSQTTQFFSGTVIVRPNAPYDDEGVVRIEQRDSFALNVLSLTYVFDTEQ